MKMKNKKSRLLRAAEYYLSLGWPVFPVSPDKVPLVNWKKYQSELPTKQDLKNWFNDDFADGLAIVTGSISKLIVLDFEKGARIPKLPLTASVATGGGGIHYYYSLPEGVKIRNSARPLGKEFLMDVRAEGGYVVAPPSKHRSGEKYKWKVHVKKHKPIKLPGLVKILLSNPENSKSNFETIMHGVQEGNRHDSAVRIAGLLLKVFDRSQWPTIVWPLLRGFGLQCKPAMNENELKQIFTDIAKKESAKEININGKLGPITLAELMAEPDFEPDWLVEHLLPNGGITILSGKAGNFKTWVILHIALCVASGKKVFGNFSTTPASILIVDEENQKRTLRKRLGMLGYDDSLEIYFWVQSGFKIDNPKQMQALADFVQKKKIKLVIFDSFVRVHSKEENYAKEVAEIFATIKQLTRMGVSVLFTHHHRKQVSQDDSQSLRGSSDILAAVDAQISVQKENKMLKFTQNKLRDAEELKPFMVIVNTTDTSLGFEYDGENVQTVKKKEKAQNLILENLKNGSKTRVELSTILKNQDIGENKINDALKDLVREEKIIKTVTQTGNLYELPK